MLKLLYTYVDFKEQWKSNLFGMNCNSPITKNL